MQSSSFRAAGRHEAARTWGWAFSAFNPTSHNLQALFFQKANLVSRVLILETFYGFHHCGEFKEMDRQVNLHCSHQGYSDPPLLAQLVGTARPSNFSGFGQASPFPAGSPMLAPIWFS